ncbi:PREDICTED: sodium- and chloride-dependent glycine transporter 2-like [Priapulus caudatus]|uniref:Transporter n=1 Tax=Priapulus caudatus TaxID=37621 RepID=A0ABM1E287_PRICU|nr:PREDICTED: sodium- and chloride-dependent glycine transporter 2-like [Priapulus caudatus]
MSVYQNNSCKKTALDVGNDASTLQMIPSTQLMLPKEETTAIDPDCSSNGSGDELERGNWTGRFDFLLSLLGYSVGLGNVWRFPYLCYKNGGGAFLIPFVVMLLIAGLPLMFMELALGQFASLSPIVLFGKFSPILTGLGYGMVIVSTVVCLYYNMIIGWSVFYLFASFTKELPWERCNSGWATKDCYSFLEANECKEEGGIYYQTTCHNATAADPWENLTELAGNATRKLPAEEYFQNFVLGISSGIEEIGELRWQLVLALLMAWLIVFLCLSRGVQTSGKVVYFTALFPYAVLVILFARGVTLPGAKDGILWYIIPDFSRLGDAQVWQDAAVQIFFALSPAWGGLITLASYNKFHNNCYKDALIVSLSNVLTSIFAGFVIFSVVGFLALELDKPIDKVVSQGAGLAFIIYPEVVTRLPLPPLWAVLFFLMLITLGLDSQFALLETVTTAILDTWPHLRERKTWVVFFCCVTGFIGGLIFCTQGGMYVLQLVDTYAASWCVILMALTECIFVAWVYGADRFLRDIETMIGPMPASWHFVWSCFWKVGSPVALSFVLVFSWLQYAPATYGADYVYPWWANVIGWVLALAPILAIPALAINQFWLPSIQQEKTFIEKLKKLVQPSKDWCQANRRGTYKLQDRKLSTVIRFDNSDTSLEALAFQSPA